MLNILAALRRDEPQLCIAAIFLSISNLSPRVIDILFDLFCDDMVVRGSGTAGVANKVEGNGENDFKIALRHGIRGMFTRFFRYCKGIFRESLGNL